VNPTPEVKSDPRRAIPAVDLLLRGLEEEAGDTALWARREAAREVLDDERARLGRTDSDGRPASADELIARAGDRAREIARPRPARVINATGIVLHTNLGRAPLARDAVRAVAIAAGSYGDLELDLGSGRRGSRTAGIEHKLRVLSGAGGALAVNNNAAAILLVLAELAGGKAAVVSRGELVEIGGSFRVPDIMASAGVRLIEVGTTNRTHLRDYEAAIGPDTALLLKVHRSNFALRGFVAEAGLEELAGLAAEHGLPVVEDLGSGTLVDLTAEGLPEDVFAPRRLARGADVVCFSGDKLLGGPQAGIILTREAALADRLRRHPLARAIRLDKLGLAALDWTLSSCLEGNARDEIPVLRQLLATPGQLRLRAEALTERLGAVSDLRGEARAEPDRSFAGGGSLPDHEIESWVVSIDAPIGAELLAKRLRAASTPVLARIRDDRVVLDMRTLLDGDGDAVFDAVLAALR
jgi:L-seryl-tRNA(Ser) seleniumtransferase